MVDVAELTARLVRVPSQNPEDGELRVVEAIGRWIAEHTTAAVHAVDFAPGRRSLAAVVRGGAGDGPALVLNGHTDTVPAGPAAAWSSDPFAGAVSDGHVHGRGSADMKGGLAVALSALAHASAARGRLAGTLVAHFAAGEERGEAGTRSLLDAGHGGDVAIVLEPTSLRVATAGRGLATYDVTLTGLGGHAGTPELTVNPLAAVGPVLAAAAARAGRDGGALLPAGSCTPTVLRGGDAGNVVPERCTLTLDRRLVPGEDPTEELHALTVALREAAAPVAVDVTLRGGSFPPVASDPDGPFARLVRARVAAHAGAPPAPWGTPFASDASRLAGACREVVVFGPGDVADVHRPDERVAVAQLRTAERVVHDVVDRVLGAADAKAGVAA